MFRFETDRALIESFRPRDRRVIEMPEGITFPLFVRDYLAWTETSGARVYLIFSAPGSRKPIGIIFRREPPGGEPATRMCDWCHNSGASHEVGLLTTDVDNRRRVGVTLCVDLRCREKLEDAADRDGRHPLEVVERLNARMFRFAQEALGIEPSPQPAV
ncbi:FBP domain-containing protein [Pyxidicoccus xibeiensis]|uniref:FBP domain-containing protein n=1 Tax=Pyxidicoccus xibeiensis TaxID=2906759 RepID=UPI0020A7B640|nr:FBP domain-containing protein [Pyxidicoccus xibeiensis]MCP3143420.1 FBP domain-containing protein [Pyxidicoccus xibeiensis]